MYSQALHAWSRLSGEGSQIFNSVCVKWKDEKMTHSTLRLDRDDNQTPLNRFLVFISYTHTHTHHLEDWMQET